MKIGNKLKITPETKDKRTLQIKLKENESKCIQFIRKVNF